MVDNLAKGTQVKSGEKFGIPGYWINKDQTHPVHLIYEANPEEKVPRINEPLEFIYFGETKPTALDISILIAECLLHPH